MKKTSFKRIISAMLFAFALAVMIPVVSTASVEAKTTKVTTNHAFKKSKAVKVGTNKITSVKYDTKKNDSKKQTSAVGWVKFTAPKAGKYEFTFKNAINKGNPNSILHMAVGAMTGVNQYSTCYPSKSLYLKTKGGKSYSLWICSNYADAINAPYRTSISASTSLPTRSTTLKLKKGETIYFDFNNSNVVTLDMIIKKK